MKLFIKRRFFILVKLKTDVVITFLQKGEVDFVDVDVFCVT